MIINPLTLFLIVLLAAGVATLVVNLLFVLGVRRQIMSFLHGIPAMVEDFLSQDLGMSFDIPPAHSSA